MSREQVVDWLEGIVFGGVAITTAALEYATDGQELTFTQWRAILFVGEDAGGCRVGEVATLLHASLPTTSRLLRRLERRGLLALKRDEQDRRATRARLTEAGAALRSAVLAYRRDRIAAIVDQANPPASAHRALRNLAMRFDARGHDASAPARAASAEETGE
ncbi:MAG TPA: MarR family winged helix-turn-helix transcriptional regulator [Candidatus Limnocylindria bacterium]